MKARHRLFTIEEASALLPELELIFSKLDGQKLRHQRLHDELFMEELLREASPDNRSNEKFSSPQVDMAVPSASGTTDSEARALEKALSDFESDIKRLKSFGCIIRHLEKGWVDFFSEHQGQYVFLSWRRGEASIMFYRNLQSSIEDRIGL